MRSAQFRMSRSRCYLTMMAFQAPWVGWSLLVLVVVLVAGGFILSPWLGLAAIGVSAFMCVMGLSFVIMSYGFYSVTGCNMSLHSLSLHDKKLIVELEDGKKIEISLKELDHYSIYPGGVVVPVGGARAGWIWIPPRAFETPEEFKQFVKTLYESNTEQEPQLLLHDGDGGARL